MSMSREEAVLVVKEMRNQKLSYEEITRRLAEKGYISDRTGKPLSLMSVRNMHVQATGGAADAKTGTRKKKKGENAPILVSGPGSDILAEISTVCQTGGLSVNSKIEFIRSLVSREFRTSSTTSAS